MKSQIDIILTSSDYYAPFTSVTMASILLNVPTDRNIAFHIITEDFSKKNKMKLMELNSIRKFDIEYKYISCKEMNLPIPPQARVSNIAYARLYAGTLFPALKRALICDSDLVFDHNISELYDIDLNDNISAIAQDPLERGEKKWWEFLDVPDQYPYLNTGVILLDLDKFRNKKCENKIINNYNLYKEKLVFIDQDLIYICLSENNKQIDQKWNFLPNIYYSDTSKKEALFEESFVYHFGGGRKPWIWANIDKAEIWWSYAKKTPFYEEILARLIDFKISQKSKIQIDFNNNMRMFYITNHLFYFKLKKLRYRLMKHITFGKKKEKYKAKYKTLKSEIKAARRFVKELKKSIK